MPDHTFASGTFMSFYYVLTGVHMLHVVMGLIILTVVMVYMRGNADRRAQVVEQGYHLLAHGGSAVGDHFRASLRDEVSR